MASKFQTGFDQPKLGAMYVDKKLSGVACVQTLSRLNRTTAGKEETFALDFENTAEDIESRKRLREILGARQSGGIIFMTIQKFAPRASASLFGPQPRLCPDGKFGLSVIAAHAENCSWKNRKKPFWKLRKLKEKSGS